ncbi:MAG TPA: tRNA uridine-5-carboxymethylaminomethyl(34) synthesis GTPase MnmE, partial [Syntrophobacteraceae bacterium]|nr:tRNA uridine-5-carboxymethylaminomethyl(34) synthesis GTPase MnmE [Syntrophobacteraceae bacterium]
MSGSDTIASIATPPGFGGVGIVRVSGPGVRAIAEGILRTLPSPRLAGYHRFRDAAGETLDSGIALFFPSPHSFTGEDVLELQGHGGPLVLDLLLRRALQLGARPARPGEFSERAFLNGKLDLVQAEAVADL